MSSEHRQLLKVSTTMPDLPTGLPAIWSDGLGRTGIRSLLVAALPGPSSGP